MANARESSGDSGTNIKKSVPVLTGEFTSKGGHIVTVEITPTEVVWKGQKSKETVIPWCDIIAVHRGRSQQGSEVNNAGPTSDDGCFTLHYVIHNGNLLRHKHRTFSGQTDRLQQWTECVITHIPRDRPKQLVVIINPIAGRKKGVQIYEKTVAPLFHLAGIQTDVIVTERLKHAEDIGRSYDFTSADSVVLSGGDGLLEEFLHTFIPRYQMGLDIHDPGVELREVPVTIGTLPTGTGNGISKSCFGCEDVETSALCIVMGKRRRLNIVSIHEPGKLIGYSSVAVGYGFWSDLINQTEEKRWLKTFRVYVNIMQSFMRKRRLFSAKGEYLPADAVDRSETDTASNGKSAWREFEGRYTGVNALVPGYYKDDTHGVLQMGQDGRGFNLLLEKDTGKMKYMTWLMKFIKYDKDSLEADFLDHHYVQAYRVRVVREEGESAGSGDGTGAGSLSREEQKHREQEHMMAVDGELRRTEKKELEVRLQPKLIDFFSSSYDTYQ